MFSATAHDFSSWRRQARALLSAQIPSADVTWNGHSAQGALFGQMLPAPDLKAQAVIFPAELLAIAADVSCHRDEARFALLYQMAWRLQHEDKRLLRIASDPLTHALTQMRKAVRRDVHKTKAFVRFRKTADDKGVEHYVAWHCPDQLSLRLSAPFFSRRFAVMRWSILAPDESAHWDGRKLRYGPGARRSDAPDQDDMEALWKTFYRAIFNPARIKIAAMKKEMPVRHWATLPEAQIIPELLAQAPERVVAMIAHREGESRSTEEFIPAARDLATLSVAAIHCQGCILHRAATRTVFGHGPARAEMMLVGEQPGDEEDRCGEPFRGPAGKVLDRALLDAGLERDAIYLTNAVKHFKFSARDGRRHHRTPDLRDIIHCKPWLEAELRALEPRLVVCLGVSAARALIDPAFKLQEALGKILMKGDTPFLCTYHPSAVLRQGDGETLYRKLVGDLRAAKDFLMR